VSVRTLKEASLTCGLRTGLTLAVVSTRTALSIGAGAVGGRMHSRLPV
jgi:hypothetical protein